MPDARRRAIDKDILSLEVVDLLGLPRPPKTFTGKGYLIVKTIFKAITDSLLRGESVSIPGFGKFIIHTRPPTRVPINYSYGKSPGPRQLLNLPAKRMVKFKPSRVLIEMINDGN